MRLSEKADIGVVSAQNATVTGNTVGATVAHPRSGAGITAFDRGQGRADGIGEGQRAER
jgi:hypothetical protein